MSEEPKKWIHTLDEEQLALLKLCSTKKELSDWNRYRNENPHVIIRLFGASLDGEYLTDANLTGAMLSQAGLQNSDLSRARLSGANLRDARLQGAVLDDATLTKADLRGVNACGMHAHRIDLRGADLEFAILDAASYLGHCEIDENTFCRTVALSSARIAPETRLQLEAVIRKRMWRQWCDERKLLGPLVRLFWAMSNYGTSTIRIIASFWGAASVFAIVYALAAIVSPPGIVEGLCNGELGPPCKLSPLLLLRSFYFSVVTMSTLGFGDITAVPTSIWGHVAIILHVAIGYLLLGALVTRLGVMFTAPGGPASRSGDVNECSTCGTSMRGKEYQDCAFCASQGE